MPFSSIPALARSATRNSVRSSRPLSRAARRRRALAAQGVMAQPIDREVQAAVQGRQPRPPVAPCLWRRPIESGVQAVDGENGIEAWARRATIGDRAFDPARVQPCSHPAQSEAGFAQCRLCGEFETGKATRGQLVVHHAEPSQKCAQFACLQRQIASQLLVIRWRHTGPAHRGLARQDRLQTTQLRPPVHDSSFEVQPPNGPVAPGERCDPECDPSVKGGACTGGGDEPLQVREQCRRGSKLGALEREIDHGSCGKLDGSVAA